MCMCKVQLISSSSMKERHLMVIIHTYNMDQNYDKNHWKQCTDKYTTYSDIFHCLHVIEPKVHVWLADPTNYHPKPWKIYCKCAKRNFTHSNINLYYWYFLFIHVGFTIQSMNLSDHSLYANCHFSEVKIPDIFKLNLWPVL